VIDESLLAAAVAGAVERESAGPRDMESYLNGILSSQSHRTLLGPYRDGSGPSGVVVHRGQTVADWGDPAMIEMSFSATKTYLSVVAGVAFDRGLIADVHAPVGLTVDDPAFASARNALITWDHLLRQTSQWDATLWDLPWWADPQGGQAREAHLGAPGSAFAYNDVRVNLLALALTRLFGESLADVLRRDVMDPIGGSSTWEWHGYENSVVEIDGRPVESVSGGAHWGGGLWMSALDHARLGQLYLHRGRWDGRQVISEQWVDASLTPAATNRDYGMLWWLNHRGRIFPDAPTGYCARGNLGRQLLWVDPARDLVVVSRWSDDVGTLLAQVSAAVDRVR
jgi:CubicO group peptidase (beta-lactamase class C family)